MTGPAVTSIAADRVDLGFKDSNGDGFDWTETGVSLPTVFRFTQTLGYDGFKDFKVDLVKDMAVGLNISMEDMDGSNLENLTKNVASLALEDE